MTPKTKTYITLKYGTTTNFKKTVAAMPSKEFFELGLEEVEAVADWLGITVDEFQMNKKKWWWLFNKS